MSSCLVASHPAAAAIPPEQVLAEVFAQRALPLPEHIGVSLVLHMFVDERQEVRACCILSRWADACEVR